MPSPLRADALRNRDALVDAARAVFTATDATAPLDSVARAAGVGIGTLYRHFPTRESLVEAVYAAELDDVVASAAPLLGEARADVALRRWFDRYTGFVAAKRGLLGTLRAGWTAGRLATPTTRERITATVATMLAAGVDDGSLRTDVEPDDVTSMLLGVMLAARDAGPAEQTARTLDLLLDALRPR